MAWETGRYCHPQGARLTAAIVTTSVPGITDRVIRIMWREHEDSADQHLIDLTLEAGHLIGVVPLGGEPMFVFDSLVWMESDDDDPPANVMPRIIFGR